MHTSALHPQVLGFDLASGPDMTGYSCTGTLARDAEVRVKPTGPEGNPTVVLCLDLLDSVPNAMAVHVEQPFSDRAKAEAIATRLRKDARVTVHCLLQDMRMSLTNATAIEPLPAPPIPFHRKHS